MTTEVKTTGEHPAVVQPDVSPLTGEPASPEFKAWLERQTATVNAALPDIEREMAANAASTAPKVRGKPGHKTGCRCTACSLMRGERPHGIIRQRSKPAPDVEGARRLLKEALRLLDARYTRERPPAVKLRSAAKPANAKPGKPGKTKAR